MQRPMNNVHNVGKETWPPAHAGNRVTNNDLATRSGPYRQIPAAQGPMRFRPNVTTDRSVPADPPSPGPSHKREGRR